MSDDPRHPGSEAEQSTETSFLGRVPPPQPPEIQADILERGAAVGRYLVLDWLGSGGMGVVYSAYDPELDRKVALKLLRPDRASFAGETGRLRLLREAQAIARLSHPNVIAVYDAGSFRDQVFVAMELVEGCTLRQWLDEERPSWRQTLERFLLAGRGLAAAHAAGLVHRDFKPDNVLLGKDGRVRVVDFGIARPLGQAAGVEEGSSPAGSGGILAGPLTQWGVALGTPGYMAPEQLRGEAADARSDQFSFCVALYEALYGERPFAGDDPREMMGAAARGAVRAEPAGSRVPKRVRRAVLRGLAADPGRRHGSMEALLGELGRNPAAVRRRWLAAAAAVLVTGTLFTGFGYYQAGRARLCDGAQEKIAGVWNAAKKEQIRAAFEATGLPFAEIAWKTAGQTLDRYTADWVQMRQQACEATRLRGEQSEDLLDRRMFCLDQRLQDAAAVADLFAHADLQIVGKAVSIASGLPRLESCADAEALTAKLPPPRDPGLRARVEAVRARIAEARALTSAGKASLALPKAQAAARQAERLGYGPLKAEALYQEAYDEDLSGDSKNAEETMFAALVAAQAAGHQELAAQAASQLAWINGFELARSAEGHRWVRLAQGIAEGAKGGDALRSELFQHLGTVLANERRFPEAVEVSLRALELAERGLGRGHPKLAPILNNLSEYLNQMGRYEEALRYAQRGLSIRQKTLDPDHPDFARSYNALGNIYDNLHREEEAAASYERSLRINQRHLGPNHWLTASALGNLGSVYQHLGRLALALQYDRQALASFETIFGPDHPAVAMVLVNMGEALLLQGNPAAALTAFNRALAIQEKAFGPDHPDVSYSLIGKSKALLALGRAHEAVPLSERALALREGKPLDPGAVPEARFILARSLWAGGGNRSRAVRLAQQAQAGLTGRGQLRDQREVESWLRERGQTR